ncbi:hypothetical protein FZC33_30125 [Labrys sp. KNU-23]|uniref:hypothetical protein n=1 Tax=Labrys sp. KNU-23 TaxID=2789216 RepID=UPI0011EDC48B|nr:hypothetical protein [Labrys sp. KNU-23]QEN90310.1 hypothetical protein FZC33_30125 [Labrys sp. KNU-23]
MKTSLGLAALLLTTAPALAGDYVFAAAPQKDLNRIYRVDRLTGEVGACQYGVKEDNTGVTLCFPAGEGAGKQEPGDYTLIASSHERESSVFRVEQRTGTMSVCYVWKDQVICTPPGK